MKQDILSWLQENESLVIDNFDSGVKTMDDC